MVGMRALVAVVLLLAVPTPARGAPRSQGLDGGQGGAIATFEGNKIDLAGDWGDATACLVWRQRGVMECFRSEAALDAREAQLGAGRPPTAGPPAEDSQTASRYAYYSSYCSSPLRLYEHPYYGGRRLSFWDRGYWQNLGDYGFDDQTSSYSVGGCYVHLAEHPNGGGWWYPGPTYPYAGDPWMGWQDVISSIYIE